MRFDPELFQQGENAFLNSKRQQQEQAQEDFDRLRAIGDTEGMRRAGKNMQGGLLSQLFGLAKDPYGAPDPQGQAQGQAVPGINGMNVGGMVKNNMNATDIYDNLQKTFEGEVGKAKTNEERARLFRSYNEKVRQADNIFGWKNADGLNVKDYLVSSGGGGGKLTRYNVYDKSGKFVDMVEAPAGLDENQFDNVLKSKYKTSVYDKVGGLGSYSKAEAGAGGTGYMDDKTRQIYTMAEQAQLDKAKENAQGILNTTPYLRNLFGINEKDKRILAENNYDQYGNKLNGLTPVEISNTQEDQKKKPKTLISGKQINM